MKLVDITPYFHRKSGGIKRYLLQKAKFLKKQEVEHVLIIPGKEKRSYYVEKTRVYELPSFPLPLTGGYRFFSSLSEIREILQKEEPDIVELGGTYQFIPFLKSDRYLLSVFYHSDIRTDLALLPLPEKIKQVLIEHTIRKKLSSADLIITPSKKQEEFLRSYGLEHVSTVNLGVDTHTFNPSKRNPYFDRALRIKQESFRLLYVGRLSRTKTSAFCSSFSSTWILLFFT